jgi:hypothetical protein
MEMFRYSGLDKEQAAGFTSHYNPALGRCFIETTNTKTFGETIWNYKEVSDAYEQKQFAGYSWHTVGEKKYWEVPPFTCSVNMPNGEEQHCKSSDEFDELIKTYMGR